MEDYRKIAIELGQTLINKAPETREDVERMLPELIESEDERIRKSLVEMVHDTTGDSLWVDYGVHKEDAIAWLEKQGKTPADKVEPKFHEGDIIIHKELGGDYIHNPHKIIQVDILDKKYRLEGGLVAHFGEQEDYELVEQKPAWSEDDEMFVHGLIRGLTAKRDIHGHTTFSSDCIDITETINWLKSIKDRVQPQSQWKPSEQDILLLERIFDGKLDPRDFQASLQGIIEQLKKLREE